MANLPPQNNKNKNKVRTICFDLHETTCTHILDIPGPDILSVLEPIKKGIANNNTEFTTIECDKNRNNIIVDKLKRKKIKNRNYQGKLEKCKLYGSYDIVNLDTCSSLN